MTKSTGRSVRTVALTLGALIALVAGPAWARQAGVSGSVTHAEGGPAADITVQLELHDGMQIIAERSAVTDAAGKVEFTDLPTGEGYFARMGASYAGVMYYSDTQPLTAGSQVSLSAVVAEVTDQGRPLHLDTLHLIVQVDEPGLYQVLQFMTVSNAGEVAYAGGPDLQAGGRAGVVIPLPVQASSVRSAPFPTPADALPEGAAEIGSDRVLDPRPVPPSGRQVAITYDLISDGEPLDIKMLVPYPTQSVSLLLGGAAAEGVFLTDTSLESRPAEQIGDGEYRMWGANSLAPDTEITFTVGPQSGGLSSEAWALIGVGLALLFAVVGSVHGGAQVHDEAERQDLIRAIAALDRTYAAGQLDSTEHHRRRAAHLERILILEEQLRDRGQFRQEPVADDPVGDDSIRDDAD